MDLVNLIQRPIVRGMAWFRVRNFLGPIKDRETFAISQEMTLERILKENEHTKFGKRFGFQDIRNPEDFGKNVPVFNYHGNDPDRCYQPWVNEIISDPNQGAGILHPQPPIAMAITSGTSTNEPKLIPQTEVALEKDSEVLSIPMFYAIHSSKDAGILDGKILTLFANHMLFSTDNGIPVGYMSGINNLSIKPNLRNRFALPLDIQNGTHLRESGYIEWNEKFREVIKFCLEKRDKITVQAGINSILDTLNEMMSEELERRGEEMQDVFGDMKAILAGGAPRRHYLKKFQHYFGNDVRVMDFFSGSECHVGSGEDCIHPYPKIAFFEGIPYKRREFVEDDIVPISKLGVGEEFKLVITNWKVYRYEGMNDLFRIKQEEPFGLEYTGRSGDNFNLAAVKLSLRQILEATNNAEEATGAISNFIVPSLGEPPNRIYLLASFKREPTDIIEFLKEVNDYLGKTNNEYASAYGSIIKPIVLKSTSFDAKDLIAEGRDTAQFKYRFIDKEIYDRIPGQETELDL